MRGYILAFAIGGVLLQQQAALPDLFWVVALLPLAITVFLLSRDQTTLFTVIREALLALIFLGVGFFWAAAFAQWRLADALPPEWEGRDIRIVGVISELPQSNDGSVRFAFDVEQVLTPGAIVPARISLAWYKERGKSLQAEAGPPLSTPENDGSSWLGLSVRTARSTRTVLTSSSGRSSGTSVPAAMCAKATRICALSRWSIILGTG